MTKRLDIDRPFDQYQPLESGGEVRCTFPMSDMALAG